jgi:DNA-binding transcriptional regulator LsrR (DeoR family)
MVKHRNTWQPSRVLILVAKAGGIEAARKLVQHFGGRRLYVPRTPMADNHEIVIGIGRRAAQVLQDEYGAESIIVPVGRDLKLDIAAEAVEKAAGGKRAAIAQALGVSYSTAKRILRKLRKEFPGTAPAPQPRKRDPRQIDIEDYLR